MNKNKIKRKNESSKDEQYTCEIIQQKDILISNNIRQLIEYDLKKSKKHLNKDFNSQVTTKGNNNKITLIYKNLNGVSMPSSLRIKKT